MPFELRLINIAQTILYVALLALVGQGILFVLAGARRENNLFYTLLRVVTKPFTVPVRKITPRQVADEHVPIVTFFILLIIFFVVTFERVDYCVTHGLTGQPGCL